jgi:hypothetical protein
MKKQTIKKQRRENKTERKDDTNKCFRSHFKVFTSRQKTFGVNIYCLHSSKANTHVMAVVRRRLLAKCDRILSAQSQPC